MINLSLKTSTIHTSVKEKGSLTKHNVNFEISKFDVVDLPVVSENPLVWDDENQSITVAISDPSGGGTAAQGTVVLGADYTLKVNITDGGSGYGDSESVTATLSNVRGSAVNDWNVTIENGAIKKYYYVKKG